MSFVIPAHDEEAVLGATLETLFASAREVGRPFEVVVVDDASTDRTVEIARRHGARTVSVGHRQIALARNSGALAARGDVLVFVDADTQVSPAPIRSALLAIQSGAIGGGALTRFDGGHWTARARGRRAYRDRVGLDVWYGPRRADPGA